MSQNPYSATPPHEPYTPGDMAYEESGASRISIMAILSILCSLPCCFIPGLGILGIAFGAVSMARIGSSHGRLYGRGAAITGILLGVIFTALWAYAAFGVNQAYVYYTKQMVPVSEQFLLAAQQRDDTKARTYLAPAAAADLTDERLNGFITAVEAEHGAIKGATTDLHTMGESFKRVYKSFNGKGRQPGYAQPGHQTDGVPIPVTIECEKGPTLAWVILDAGELEQHRVLILDIFMPRTDLTAFTLRKDAEGAQAAGAMSFIVKDFDALPPATPSAPPHPPESPAPPAPAAPPASH